MHVSVIIPFRGSTELLSWALQGYAQQGLGEVTCEVLVGADGCPLPVLPADGAGIAFRGFAFERMGAAAVRNHLIDKATGEALIFGNADCRPAPDFVTTHARTLASLPAGSMVLGHSPWERPAKPTVFDALLAETPMVFFFDRLRPGGWHDFRCAWTLNLSVRRADASHGFEELLRPVYYEDLVFALRLLGPARQGVYYEPAARVLHRHPTTWEQYLDREELLGLMTPVLARVAPEAFAAIHGGASIDDMRRDYAAWTKLDAPMHQWIYRRMAAWATRDEKDLGEGDVRRQMLETIYQMHIPLKRLAFRVGFLRGLELTDDSLWTSRIPASLWREVAAPTR